MTAAAAMVREEAFTFGCEGQTLLGILHHPAAADGAAQAARTGVVVIVGGPQYRAGSHRQFVHLARALAQAGHPVLRFDVRGMGDSGGAQRSFEQISADIAAALDALFARAPGVQRAVLWGLCDGASAALLYLHERADARVQGLSLANPWVRTDRSAARTRVRHYYLQRLFSWAFWRKLVRGQVGIAAVRDLGTAVRASSSASGSASDAGYTVRMAQALFAFRGKVQISLSGHDYTAREFEDHAQHDDAWRRALERACVVPAALPDADHTFSSGTAKALIAAQTVAWLRPCAQENP